MPHTIFNEPWINPRNQSRVVALMRDWNLLKHDPTCRLPVKSGGTTDLYINLPLARDNPHAIEYLAIRYANALQQLQGDNFGVTRFVEVPNAVSCIAGPLSTKTRMPYLTIRTQPKPGRVSDARVIGTPKYGESVCIIDDVIHDGVSKIAVYRKCVELGLHVVAIVVLVDRNEGWRANFQAEGIDLPVWAGMTLNDVRRHL